MHGLGKTLFSLAYHKLLFNDFIWDRLFTIFDNHKKEILRVISYPHIPPQNESTK